MSKRTKIIIVVIAVVILIVTAYFIFRKKKLQDQLAALPSTSTSPVASSGPAQTAPKWIPNKFPLDINMQGDYVFALQQALNRINPGSKIPTDGIFGPSTKTKLLLTVSTSQSALPMSGATWQQIIIDSNK